MIKKLEKLCKSKNLCCFYGDENDTEGFIIGWVVAVAKGYFIVECVTPYGYHDGFTCDLIDNLIKIEEKSKYLASVEKLWFINNQERKNMPIKGNECLISMINYAMNNNRVCFVEICESGNIDSLGYIKSFDDEMVVINRISKDFGEYDGEEILNCDRISKIQIGAEEQVRLEKLRSTVTGQQ